MTIWWWLAARPVQAGCRLLVDAVYLAQDSCSILTE
jgi:hypothetical protein